MTQEENSETWRNSSKKKFLGIGVIPVIVILGIVLVLAAVITYNYIYQPSHTGFVKNVTVNPVNGGGGGGGGGNQNQYVSVVTGGDISNSILNCQEDNSNIGCNVSTGNITLVNTDPISNHSCSILTNETDGLNKVNVSYVGITNSSNIIIANDSSLTFSIVYNSSQAGNYQMNTSIDCP